MFTRVMMRPRPKKKVEVVEETKVFTRCDGCVTRKLCDDVNACMYGTKKKKAKGKSNGRNGRVPAK